MIYPISELPKVGDKIWSQDNPLHQKEPLECVGLVYDQDDTSIIYALFKNLDCPELNDKIENGIPFYCMFGYTDIESVIERMDD